MADFLLLRFRDILRSTVEEHNRIVEQSANHRVLWGWWKKELEPFPDPYLSDLRDDLNDRGSSKVYFVNSENHKVYSSDIFKIFYCPDKHPICIEDKELKCPDYYKDTKLDCWFEIGMITEISTSELGNFVFSPKNCTTSPDGSGNFSISQARIGQVVDTTDFKFLNDNVSLWLICKKDSLNTSTIKRFPGISYNPYETRGRYILHLSDLLFGVQHTFAISKNKGSSIGKHTLLESICRDLKMQGINYQEIALVVITGDITCTASPQEFNVAARFIDEAAKCFGISAGQVVCVPGNHDIEWVNGDGNIDEEAELNYRQFFYRVYKDEPEESLVRINEFNISGKTVAVIGLNSCRLESKETAGIGFVGSEQIQQVEDFFAHERESAHERPIDYKIALVHHHLLPVNYTEQYNRKQKEVSLLLDSEALMQCLIENKVNTILHGHQHQPYFAQIRRMIPSGVAGHENGIDGTLNIIGGGSVGVNQAGLNSIGRNTYQLLELCDDGKVKVTLRVRNSDGVGYICGWSKAL